MSLESIAQSLGKLYSVPAYVLVLLFCVVACRVLRNIKKFPNEGISLAVVLLGMVLNGLIADPLSDSLSFRIWLCKNALIGGIIGFAAWFGHERFLLKFKFLDSKTEANRKRHHHK